MKRLLAGLAAALALSAAMGAPVEFRVTTVDFLQGLNLEVNGAGPLLLRADPPRHRIVLANTLTASVSVIDCASHTVRNLPIGNRVPQWLKTEALAVNPRDGAIYVIGERALHVLLPGRAAAVSVATGAQYESVAVDEASGRALLASRASEDLLLVDPADGAVRRIRWAAGEEAFGNLNMTPPPPIRKVVADAVLGRFVAVDGSAAALYLVDPRTGELGPRRDLPLAAGGRWHLAGYDSARHVLYLVTETAQRKVMQAARIRTDAAAEQVVPLPGLAEGVGMAADPKRDELYIAYDNDPLLHVVDFKTGGTVADVALPAYGNDAAALDAEGGKLYVASWAFGEVDRIDLATRRLDRRYKDLGVIPHMFGLAWDPVSRRLYVPIGAAAVNGSFGAALTVLDPDTGTAAKVRTGWAPVDMVWSERRGAAVVFNSEDAFAEVFPDGSFCAHALPFAFPTSAVAAPDGDIYLAYGPHQSYWPVVYIWGAKNGLLRIGAEALAFDDRRLPRQAHEMALDEHGVLYMLQNCWGKEKQFLTVLPDAVREFSPQSRYELEGEYERENAPRFLRYDPGRRWLYVARDAETDNGPGSFYVLDAGTGKTLHRLDTGPTPADCAFDDARIYIADFGNRVLRVIEKDGFGCQEVPVGEQPLRLAIHGDWLLVLNHAGRSLGLIDRRTLAVTEVPVPGDGRPDNIADAGGTLFMTAHGPAAMDILTFHTADRSFQRVHRIEYPFGDARFDSRNVAFFLDGRFGDAIFEISRIRPDPTGRVWISDFLSGKLFIVERRPPGGSR
jgi:DNA-binding beta-propeller fold protein YncE